MMIRRVLTGCFCALLLQGCTLVGKQNNGAIKIDDVRPVPPVLKTVRFTIQREDLKRALSEGTDLNSIRIIPLYTTANPVSVMEYRLFDIRPESAFHLIGIQNSDILVAANGYLVQEPQQFATYVRLLLNRNDGFIEVRRSGVPTLLQYSFVPPITEGQTPENTFVIDESEVVRPRLVPGTDL